MQCWIVVKAMMTDCFHAALAAWNMENAHCPNSSTICLNPCWPQNKHKEK